MRVYKLAQPIERVNPKEGEEKTLSEVSLRRMLAGDMRVADRQKGEVAQALALLSQVSGIDIPTLERLDAEDFQALADMLAPGKA